MRDIEIRISGKVVNGELQLESPRVIDLSNNNKLLRCRFTIKESQERYGYIHFPKGTGFQDLIKDGREVQIEYKDEIYNAHNYKPTAGRVNGLSKFFKDNPELTQGEKIIAELDCNSLPLVLKMKHLM